jgi:hypothetical protein
MLLSYGCEGMKKSPWTILPEQGSAEFPAFGNSAAFVEEEPQSLKGKTLRYPAARGQHDANHVGPLG